MPILKLESWTDSNILEYKVRTYFWKKKKLNWINLGEQMQRLEGQTLRDNKDS